MIKELKVVFFISVIIFFFIFTGRYYFSDINKKNTIRYKSELNNKINSYSENLTVLKNNTENIIEYVENETNKEKKRYFFWELLNKND